MLHLEAFTFACLAALICALPQIGDGNTTFLPTAHLESSVTGLEPSQISSTPGIVFTAHIESSATGLTTEEPTLTEHLESSITGSGEPESTEHVESSITPIGTPKYTAAPFIQKTAPPISTAVLPIAHTEISASASNPGQHTALGEQSPSTNPSGIIDIIGSALGGGTGPPATAAPQSQIQAVPTVTIGTQVLPLTSGISTVLGTGSSTTLVVLTTNSAGQSMVVIGGSSSILPPPATPTAPPAPPAPPAITVGTQAITLTEGLSTVLGTGSATTLVAITTNLAGQSIVIVGTSTSTLLSTGTSSTSLNMYASNTNSLKPATLSKTASSASASHSSGAVSVNGMWKWDVDVGIQVFLGIGIGIIAMIGV
ncbi:hypothetical protein K432DRAFT_379472 [Lepidopterella palustris CBS 459.81]|uniref:Uncharacterized protein n=1 Tax=Lepidopterella palustris CBS 459.81 TaxID=1314670 RepID=A0A8E2EGP0_9PEZI|nr:hypothetical protein K432DRAFT_379472 [Lepidopterella palustris CBS 459.81]